METGRESQNSSMIKTRGNVQKLYSNRSLNGDIGMSGRSERIMHAGFKFKGNNKSNMFDFNKNDRAYDSVAESLYRIHNKLNKTAERRTNRIQAGV